MKKIFLLAAVATLVSACSIFKNTSDASAAAKAYIEDIQSEKSDNVFPKVNQGGKIAIVAHRGFWKSNAGGMSENSIASLKAAQDAGLWGSECDVHLTADGIVMVNHNSSINGKSIRESKYSDFNDCLLPNGERRPTFDEYLTQAEKSDKTILVVELKIQKASSTMTSEDRENAMVEKCLALIKEHGLYSPARVAFISFSHHMCELIAQKAPEFINQFLLSPSELQEVTPAECAKCGINGIDYHYKLFNNHPEWVKEAAELGMSTNVWTVNKVDDINYQIGLGVNAITTNEPLLVRDLLGKKEFKIK